MRGFAGAYLGDVYDFDPEDLNQIFAGLSPSWGKYQEEYGHEGFALLAKASRQEETDRLYSDKAGNFLSYIGNLRLRKSAVEALKDRGKGFEAHPDRLLMEAFSHWGPDILPHLQGDFAFAYYNKALGSLLLGRDPFGLCPLYIGRCEKGIYFATDLKALMKCPSISDQLSFDSLAQTLHCGLTSGPQTLLDQVQRVTPGTIIHIDKSQKETIAAQVPMLQPDDRFTISKNMYEGEEAFDVLMKGVIRNITDHRGTPIVLLNQLLGEGPLIGITQQVSTILPETTSVAYHEDDQSAWSHAFDLDHTNRMITRDHFWDTLAGIADAMDDLTFPPLLFNLFAQGGPLAGHRGPLMASLGARITMGEMEVEDPPKSDFLGLPLLKDPSKWEKTFSQYLKGFVRQNKELKNEPFLKAYYTHVIQGMIPILQRLNRSAKVGLSAPYLDPEMIAFGLSIPDHLRTQGRENQFLIRFWLHRHVSWADLPTNWPELSHPYTHWIHEEGEALSRTVDKVPLIREFLDLAQVRALFYHHNKRHDPVLFRVLLFALWGLIHQESHSPTEAIKALRS